MESEDPQSVKPDAALLIIATTLWQPNPTPLAARRSTAVCLYVRSFARVFISIRLASLIKGYYTRDIKAVREFFKPKQFYGMSVRT